MPVNQQGSPLPQAYRVRIVTSGQELERVLNEGIGQGYRYRDAVPVETLGTFGGTATGHIFVVLEHVDVQALGAPVPVAAAHTVDRRAS